MAADLTRFDFHAFRFMRSEDVRAMDACEVGQYILLLCEAWLTGKDASLPTDREYLAKLARTEEVSPRVLKKFDVVSTPWGERLRNETLYDEWVTANQRSENGRKAVESRWNYERNTPVSEPYIPKPNQSVSNQTNPNQTNSTGNFSNLAVRYRRSFGAKLSRGSKTQERYAQACKEFSEDAVLKAFDGWQEINQWIREKFETGEMKHDGLRSFYDSLPELIAEDKVFEKETVVEESDEELQRRVVEQAQRERAEREKDTREQEEQEEEIARRLKENPAGLFTSL